MTTMVLATTEVVKSWSIVSGDNRCQSRQYERVTTLIGRIARVQEICGQPGAPISLRKLARRAGLAETHLGTLVQRLRDRPGATIEIGTLTKIACAAGVDERWLATGEGSPFAGEPRMAPHPELDQFLLEKPDADAAIVDLLRAEARSTQGLTLDCTYYAEMYDRIDRALTDVRKMAKAGAFTSSPASELKAAARDIRSEEQKRKLASAGARKRRTGV